MPQISIEQIFRQSLSAVRHGWVTYLALGAVINAPAIVLQLVSSEQLGAPFSVHWVANVMVALVATPLYAAAMVAASIQVLREHPASFAVALGTAARRWPASLAVYLMSTCGVLLGLVLCIAPGIVVAILVFVSFPVLIAEEQGILESLFGRGWRITEGNRIPIAVLVLLIGGVTVVFSLGSFALTFVTLDFEAVAEGRQGVSAWYVLGNWLVGLVFGPLVWVLSTATYFELIRVRGELPGDLVAQTAAVFD